MDPHDILARAQQDIAARRTTTERQRVAVLAQRWSGWPMWLFPALVGTIILGFLRAPSALPAKLLLSMGGLCGLRPTHSYMAGGVQLPLESRMLGMYAGFLITLVALLAMGRLGARRLGSPWMLVVIGLFFASMIGDGVNSTLMEFKYPHLYLYGSTNLHRLVTGLLWGIATASVVVWLMGPLLPLPLAQAATVHSPWTLLGVVGLNGLFALLVVQEWATFYYPIALLGVVGAVVAMASIPFLILLRTRRIALPLPHPRVVIGPAALAILLGMAVVVGTATLRWTSGG